MAILENEPISAMTQISAMLVSILVRCYIPFMNKLKLRAMRDPKYQKEIKKIERQREKTSNSVHSQLIDNAYSAPLDDENADIYSLQFFRNFVKLQHSVCA
jgi:hypothetical protein